MYFLFGLIIALGSLWASIHHLGQNPSAYFDFVAMMMVLGGTAATALITLPWSMTREILRQAGRLAFHRNTDKTALIQDCLDFSRQISVGNNIYVAKRKDLAQQVLQDGAELINLGFTPDKIEPILKERLYQAIERTRTISNAVRSLAKYPPAFGLAGTVLGLVHLMHGVSEGVEPKETGIRMAIALVATFYGLLMSNLIVNPMGEAMYKHSHEDEKAGEIALQAVLLAAERTNLLETQEMLNSFVSHGERVDVLGLTGNSVPAGEIGEKAA